MTSPPHKKKLARTVVRIEMLEPRVLFAADVLPVMPGDAELSSIDPVDSVFGSGIFADPDAMVGSSPSVDHNIDTWLAPDGAVPITPSQLHTTDTTTPAVDLVYTISADPTNGRVALTTAPWAAVTTFTQQDIDDGKLIYVNLSGGTSDSFDFSVSDGTDTVTDTFTLQLSSPLPVNLSSGIEINMDGGNDAYLSSEPLNLTALNATTIEIMFAGRSDAGSTHLMAINSFSSPVVSIGIDNSSGALEVSVGSEVAALTDQDYSALLLDGELHSLAFVWSSSEGAWGLYVDGHKVGSGVGLSEDVQIPLPAANVLLGQHNSFGVSDSVYSGNFYDVRIWDQVRSDADIAHNAPQKIDWSDSNLIANWQMEPTGQIVEVADLFSGNLLSEKHISGAGYTDSEARHDLNVDENSQAGTHIGYLVPHESESVNFVEQDGDFSLAGDPAGSTTYANGTLGGWTVTGGTVDHMLADGVFSDHTLLGGNSVRHSDFGAAVAQTLATEAGRLYQLTYSVAGDFTLSPDDKQVMATAGNVSQISTSTMQTGWSLQDNMGWRHQSLIFAAESATTELSFESLDPNIMIADVRVVELSDEVNSVLASQRDMNYDPVTGKFYKLISSHKTTITGAQNTSVAQTVYGISSRVVTIHSAYENARVNNLIEDLDKGIWLGASDADVEGNWQWSMGDNVKTDFWQGNQNGVAVNGAYYNWKAGLEPNDYAHTPTPGEDYAVMDTLGRWNDEPTLTGLNYGMYEWDANDVAAAYQFDVIAGPKFAIDNDTGEVVVSSVESLDHEQLEEELATFTVVDQDSRTGTYNATVFVDNVNEAPIGTAGSLSVVEDGVLIFSEVDFSFTDIENNSLQSIIVDVLPAGGLLQLNNINVVAGQEIPRVELSDLTYTPAANAAGVGYDGFEFYVRDDGGVENSGQDISAFPDTLAIDVIAVNDPPSGFDSTININEGTTQVFSSADFGFSDPFDNHNFDGILVDAINGSAGFFNGTSPVSAGDWIPISDINAGNFKVVAAAGQVASSVTLLDFIVTDDGGTGNGGIDTAQSSNTITINIANLNDPPTGTNKIFQLPESSAQVFNSTDFGFNDLEGNQFVEVVIDVLPLDGQLLFDGNAVSAGQAVAATAIDSGRLEYQSASVQGVVFNTDSFDFSVRDDGGALNGGSDLDPTPNTISFEVLNVNVAPTGTNSTVEVIEDSYHQFSAADFGFTDPDADALQSLQITSLPIPGSLELSGNSVGVGQNIIAADIANLRYYPDADGNGSVYSAFNFKVQDTGGTLYGGIDIDPTDNTIIIDVLSVNDAPAGSDASITIFEDSLHQFSAADFEFSDPDGDSLDAIRIESLPANGVVELGGQAVSIGDEISPGQFAGLGFRPDLNAHGNNYASFYFRVLDDGGVANGGVDTAVFLNKITFDVLSVNDAPTGTDATINVDEFSSYSFVSADFGFTDSEADNFATLTIKSLPATGSLTHTGAPVTVGQTINAGAINGLVYQPGTVGGNSVASFDFQVQDTGGTLFGGIDRDPTDNTITINLQNINLPPAGTDKTLELYEDGNHIFSASDFGFTDSDFNQFTGLEIVTVPSTGLLALNGSPVNAGQFVAVSNIADLVFTPLPDQFGSGYASFGFKVRDNGGTVNGGSDTDPVANLITLDVLSVNDAPGGTDGLIAVNEYSSHQFMALDFGFTDLEPDNFATVEIITLPATGTLSLAGVDVIPGQAINAGSLSNLLYVLNSSGGSATSSFTFKVQDTGGTVNGGVDTDPFANTITFVFSEVNLAPSGSDSTITVAEDSEHQFVTSDFGFTDLDQHLFDSIEITSLPLSGALTLSGVSVTTGQIVTVAQLSGLKFAPVANENGIAYAEIDFKVRDNGGVANGGANTAPVANTITFDVLSVNDSPSGTNTSIAVNEYSSYPLAAADFGFSDLEGDSFATVEIKSLPATGTLSYNGVPVAVGQVINAGSIPNLVYMLNSSAGNATSGFDFQVQDTGGTSNGGVDTDPLVHTITFVLSEVNLAPSGTDSTVAIVEDGSYIFQASNFGFTDPDQHTFESVEISSLPVSGSLTLSGTSVTAGQMITVAQLSGLNFTPAANDYGIAYAEFDFRVRDDGGVANGGVDIDPVANKITIDVQSVNDAPFGSDSTITLSEDTAHQFVVSDFGFADPDQDAFYSVEISTLPLTGALNLSGVSVVSGQVVSVADLANLTYMPVSNQNGTAYAEIGLKVRDDGGIANGGVDTDPVANNITIDVQNVNDAPSGSDTSIAVNEYSSYPLAAADFGFSDLEGDSFATVEIKSLPATGTLSYNGVPVAVGQVINAGSIPNLVYMLNSSSGNATSSFDFQVQDTGGTSNGGVDTDPLANTITFVLSEVNLAPTGTDSTLAIDEDEVYLFQVSDFGFTDPDLDAFGAVEISALPTSGVLTLSGVNVVAGQIVSVADLGSLAFTPVANDYGSAYDSIGFKVRDDGGSANGGVDTDPIANVLVFDVASVNDAPAGIDNAANVLEHSTYTFAAVDFGFNDPESDNFATLTIDSLPSVGMLMLSGSPVAAGQVVNAGLLDELQYQLASGSGNTTDSFAFTVQDTGGVANGGVDTDPTPNTFEFNLLDFNRPPSGSDSTIQVLEDSLYQFAAFDFGFTDPDQDALASVEINSVPVSGDLTLSGVSVIAGQSIATSDLANLVFTPVANEFGVGYGSIDFKARDDGGTANGGIDTDTSVNTINIDVLSVNDAPAGFDNAIVVNEYSSYQFDASDFGFSDVEPDNFATLTINTLPAVGTLTYAGVDVIPGQTINAGSLSNLEYQLDSNAGTTAASFDFQVRDTGGVVNGGMDTDPVANTITFALTNVNLAPAGLDSTIIIDEDSSYSLQASDFGFVDPDQNNLESVVITSLPAAGNLTLSGAGVAAGQVVPVVELNNLQFTPAVNDNGNAYAAIGFVVRDDGGNANGGSNTDPSVNTLSINVLGVNDAPQGTDNAISLTEHSAYNFSSGDFGFSDFEQDNFATVTIDQLPSVGTLTLSGVPVAPGQTINAGQLVELQYQSVAINGIATDSFTFSVQDTGGVANGGKDTDATANTFTINLLEFNRSPSGSDSTIVVVENASYAFSASDFGFADVDSNNFAAIKVVSIPNAGQLSLAGTPVVPGQFITVTDITNLVFDPAPNANGSVYSSYTFQVQDDGGTDNGGADTDPVARTISIAVSPANDEPTGTDANIVLLEDSTYRFAASDFGFTDPDGNNFSSVEITTLPAAGALSLAGVPVALSQSIAVSALSDLEFLPDAGDSGVSYSSFGFKVTDDGGTLNGGSDTDSTENVITIDVVGVNDAPSGTDQVLIIPEDGLYQFNSADFGFTDTDLDSFESVTIVQVPSRGELTFNGVPVAAGQIIASTNINALEFKPDANDSGNGYTELPFVVRDDGGIANGGIDTDPDFNKIVFDVTAVSDAPEGADLIVEINEDAIHSFSTEEFGFSDIDGDNFSAIVVESVPVKGVLSLNGVEVVSSQQIATSEIENLAFKPAPDAYGLSYSSFDFRVLDDGIQTNGSGNISVVVNTVSFDVAPVNDPPVGEDASYTLYEDTEFVFSAQHFGYADLENDQFLGVVIDQLPLEGSLLYNNVEVVPDEVILAADIDVGGFVYKPSENAFGTSSFKVRVIDTGGVEGNGENTDSTSRTLTLDVLAVNDPPEAAGSNILLGEGEEYVLAVTDFEYSDVVENDHFKEIVVVDPPVSGALRLNNTVVINGQHISVDDIQNGSLVYVAPATTEDYQEAFSFYVVDDGGTSNAGADVSVDPAALTFFVDPVNESPVLTIAYATLDEGSSVVISTAELFATDTDDNAAQLTVTVVETPVHGDLTFDGELLEAGGSFTVAQLQGDRVRYVHDGSETNTDSALISVSDGGEDGAVPVAGSLQFNIIEVIDAAPAVSNDRVELVAPDVDAAAESSAAVEIRYDVLGNDPAGLAGDADQLMLSIHTQATNGTVVLNDDGTFSYFPLNADVAEDQFSYKLTNSDGVSSIATVDLVIEPAYAAANNSVSDLGGFLSEPVVPQTVETEESLEEQVEELEVQQAADTSEEETADEEITALSAAGPQAILSSGAVAVEPDGPAQELLPVVQEFDQYRADGERNDTVNVGLDKISVQQHNRISNIDVDFEPASVSTSSFQIELDVVVVDARYTVENRSFQRGLGQAGELLEQSESERDKRISIGTDTALGVSISVSAGALAWLLRGGSLVASMIAVTPLWSSIDPLKIAEKQLNSANDEGGEVERIFD